MALRPGAPPTERAREILELARRDRDAAREALAALPAEAQVALVCEAPVARRAALLTLLEDAAPVVPRMPAGELCFTAKAVGLADAGWILEHASDDQLVACVDLDAWAHWTPDREKLHAWMEAFVDAGEDTLLRAARALDFEELVLWVRDRAEVSLKPSASEDEGWEPPPGAQTLEGQFHLVARREKDDLSELLTLLRVLFEQDYWVYYRLMQGAMWELDSDAEEWAARWRTGRLQDMGFPTWEESKRIYAWLRPEQLDRIPERSAPTLGEWPLPIWMPKLPASREAELLLWRALAELGEEERRPCLFAFLALANRVAVADELPLGDAESMPVAIDKAARLASRGLGFLVERHGLAAAELLRRVPLERLFRVGHHLERAEAGPDGPADEEDASARA